MLLKIKFFSPMNSFGGTETLGDFFDWRAVTALMVQQKPRRF